MELLRRQCDHVAERGITLVETLAAVLILSLVAISVLTMFSQGMLLNITGSDLTRLTNEARHKAEELMALDFNDADLAPDVTHSIIMHDPYELAISWQVGEHRIIQGADDVATVLGATPLASSFTPGGNIKVIAVTVASRAEVGAGQRNVTVQTIKLAENTG